MKPLKIYLGDLTYDTVTLSTEAMPLNIGYIATYCKKHVGSDVEITLFKYIDELDKAIHESPPDILALSNYCWSKNVSLEMFRMLSKQNPQALTIWGGPNFPIDLPSQEKFMEKHPVDIYVPIDGEVGFLNIIERALQANSTEQIKEKVLSKPIDGCISRGSDGKLQYTIPVIRMRKLDEIPSPYTTGILDKFFDGKLTPMMQTNRGCPFKCTFCADGKDEVNQVNSFSTERVKEELYYIVKHIPSGTHNIIFSDLNFGMYPRDQETSNYIAELQKKYDYPHFIYVSTGKNQKEKIINAIKILKDSLRLWMSVQTLDQQVLTNIKRDNISIDHMLQLYPAIKESKLLTRSETILGLPGETYQSHIKTLRDLVRARMDEIQVHTCMLLDGSEMGTIAERKKWNIKSKFRILQRDFAELSNNKRVMEIEEVVVSSDTMNFEEYVELRLLAFIIYVTNRGIVYDPITKLLREYNVDIFDFFYKIMKEVNNAPDTIRKLFNNFKDATVNELWDSEEEIITNYQNDSEYQKLLNGDAGINVMYHFLAEVTVECMDEWTDYILKIAYEILKELDQFGTEVEKQFVAVSNYCKGIAHNTLGNDRMLTNPEFEFEYNIIQWLEDPNESPLGNFKRSTPYRIQFQLTDEQFKSIQDTLNMYGETTVGRSKALRMISSTNLWRRPKIIV